MEYPEVDGDAHLSYFGLEINFLGNFGPEDLYLIFFTMVCNIPKQNVCKKCWFNPIQDGLFRDCSRLGGSQKGGGGSLKSVTHILQWWNLAQIYLTQRRSKAHMNHVTHHLSSADISLFSTEITKFCFIKKYTYRLYFDT